MSVERFWCPRDGFYALDNNGFLRDPEATLLHAQSANPGVSRTDDLAEHRSLVLLGEPGAGKSTALQDVQRLVATGIPIVRFDLASYGSEDRLVREVFKGSAIDTWSNGAGELCLVLDSLDEAQSRLPHAGAILADQIRRLACDRLHVRIACRTADWPSGLESSLAEAFGDTAVMEILPLRQVDAGTIAAEWCEPSPFIREVQEAGAGPLAARPLTLRFLARAFGESGSLPDTGVKMYTAGIRSLCEEQNVARRDGGLAGVLTLNERVAVARRFAAATVFGNASAIWTGPEVESNADDIAVDQVVGSTEPSAGGPTAVTAIAAREAMRTGLFSGRGGQRLGWAHATFADFLAADWLVANDLSAEQAWPLLLGPDGRCWPQTRLTAAWAVAMAPERFGFLTTADPAAFQGEVELPGDALRSAVIDGLFSVANTLTAARWERSYRALRHSDIADQLRPRLRDADPDIRRLALELADECAAVELRDELEAIATDTTADVNDRVKAGWALTRLKDPHRSTALLPLALDDTVRGDDPADDLKGVSLLASWPQALSTAKLFSLLTRRKQPNFHGAYAALIDHLRTAITTTDRDAGIRWLLDDLDGPADDHILGALANRVLELAATSPADPAIVDAFAQIVVARSGHYHRLLYEDFHDERGDPLADSTLRRAVAAVILDSGPTDQVLYRLSERGSYSLGVIRADDLEWLSNRYAATDAAAQDSVSTLFSWTYDDDNADHRNLVLDMDRDHPLHIDLIHAWVDAVALDSTEAAQMRQSWEMFHGSRPAASEANDDIEEQIDDLLDRFDEGEAFGFWGAMRLLTVAPGSKHYGAEFDPDLAGMDRWPTLTEQSRNRLVDAAERYLQSQVCDPQQWLGRPEIRYHPAEAGYQALTLLLRVAPERLRQLSTAAWIEWAPLFATWSTDAVNGAKWEDKRDLLSLTPPAFLDAMRQALITRVESAVLAGKSPSVGNEAGYAWDDAIARSYLELARTADAAPRTELVASLAEHDFETVRPLLLAWLGDPAEVARRRLAAGQLFDSDLKVSWPVLKSAFDHDLEFAEQVLGQSLTVRGFERSDEVSPSILGDIYLWLRIKFPPNTDPQFDDVHAVGPREQIGHWRDNLLAHLRDLGTADAVRAIRTILAALPGDRWLSRTLAIAETALRRNEWAPTPMRQLIALAADRRSTVVNSAAGLAAAAAAALGDVQGRLTGGTPESHYLWDTHAKRPKSEDEISDYLANELNRALVDRGAIVNREVQVRRNQPSGIGERTDLLIDAIPVDGPNVGRLSLPVEVKVAWNVDLLTAASDQLVDRYMRDAAATHGIYIVAWPDLESWADTSDARRASVAKLDRPEVEAHLAEQAAVLEQQGASVSVVHLDIAYRRPV